MTEKKEKRGEITFGSLNCGTHVFFCYPGREPIFFTPADARRVGQGLIEAADSAEELGRRRPKNAADAGAN